MAYSIKIEGIRETKIALDKVNKDVIAELRGGCNKGAGMFAQKAVELAPRGPGKPSKGYYGGRLKSAMVHREMPYNDYSPIVSIAAVDRKIAPHAHLVEFGTSKAKAHPYFRPAFNAMKERVKQVIIAALKRALLKAGNI